MVGVVPKRYSNALIIDTSKIAIRVCSYLWPRNSNTWTLEIRSSAWHTFTYSASMTLSSIYLLQKPIHAHSLTYALEHSYRRNNSPRYVCSSRYHMNYQPDIKLTSMIKSQKCSIDNTMLSTQKPAVLRDEQLATVTATDANTERSLYCHACVFSFLFYLDRSYSQRCWR